MRVALYEASAVSEHVVNVVGLADADAARLLLSMAKSCLSRDEFARGTS